MNCQTQEPKRGWISTTYRNYKGKKLGPYYVRRWKVGKKLHREYINAKDLKRVQAECDAYRAERREGQRIRRWVVNCCGNLNYVFRMCKWQELGKLRPQDHAYARRLKTEGFDIDGRPSIRSIKPQRNFVAPLIAKFAENRSVDPVWEALKPYLAERGIHAQS